MAFSKRHYARLSNGGPDTAETIASRAKDTDARAKGREDAFAKFGEVTIENVHAFLAYQEERIRFHQRAAGLLP